MEEEDALEEELEDEELEEEEDELEEELEDDEEELLREELEDEEELLEEELEDDEEELLLEEELGREQDLFTTHVPPPQIPASHEPTESKQQSLGSVHTNAAQLQSFKSSTEHFPLVHPPFPEGAQELWELELLLRGTQAQLP